MSTPAKHTAGPWTVLEANGEFDIVGPANYARHNGLENTWSVALVEEDVCAVRAVSECRANARLIAAAPDLLAALIEVKAAFDDGLCNSGTRGFDSGRLDRALNAASTAIALASPVLEREGK